MRFKELVWLSDVHADDLRSDFLADVEVLGRERPEGILITGDISNAERLDEHLTALSALRCPIFFVLGNHDYWNGSFAGVTAIARSVCLKKTNLVFLDQSGLVQLGGGTVLIGGQGWGDGQAGLGEQSPVTSRDRQLIQEFADKPRDKYFKMLRVMGRGVSIWLFQNGRVGARRLPAPHFGYPRSAVCRFRPSGAPVPAVLREHGLGRGNRADCSSISGPANIRLLRPHSS